MRKPNKAPAPVAAGSEGYSIVQHSRQDSIIGPRLRRLLEALLREPEISREQADRIAHASNSPHLVCTLRHRYGIPVRMRMASGRDFDGQSVRFGVYSLDDEGRAKAQILLSEGSHALPN